MIIGSFQRDSLGTNLVEPKWQKGPDILVDILKALPSQKYILLLAGPRRHYLLQSCRRNQIPYYYIGKETSVDDLSLNSVSIDDMPGLYALCDLYLITSRSEGGPKAVLEATAMNVPVVSSDVGLAGDFIDRRFIYRHPEEGKAILAMLLTEGTRSVDFTQVINKQGERTRSILSYEAMDRRLHLIYESLLSRTG